MLSDKTAVITDGGKGVGRVIALRLAHGGASVAVLDIDKQAAADTVREIEAFKE